MERRHALLGAVLLCAAAPALPCSYSQAPEPVGHASAEYFAARMGPQASFIDVAVAESSSPAFGARTGWPVPETRFRVVWRLKGQSPDRFSLLVGRLAAGETAPGPQHWVDETGRILPFPYPVEAQLAQPSGMSSCDPGMLRVRGGESFLVFREADGRLLGAVPLNGQRDSALYPLVPVALDEPIGWLQATLTGIGRAGEPAPQGASATIAGVRFSRGLNPAEALRWAERASLRPVMVSIARGRLIEEYRVPADHASTGLIGHAFAGSAASRGQRSVAALAAQLLDESDERLEIDSSLQLRANLLIESAMAEPPADAPARVVAMEVTGAAGAIARLAAAPLVAETAPGALVRGRAASRPLVQGAAPAYPFQYQWKRERGASVRARLIAIAQGRAPPEPQFLPPEPQVDPYAATGCVRIGEDEALALGAPLLAAFGEFKLYASPGVADCTHSAEALTCRVDANSAVRLDVGQRIGGFRTGPQPAAVQVGGNSIMCRRETGP